MKFKTSAEVYFTKHGKPPPEPKGYKTEEAYLKALAEMKELVSEKDKQEKRV